MSEVVFYLHRQVAQVVRFMMGQAPQVAERMIVSVPELDAAIERGNGALELHLFGEVSYTVIRNGERYTSTERPADVPPEHLTVVHVPEPTSPILLPRLEAACSVLKRDDPDAYAMYGIEPMLESVRSYYEPHAGEEAEAVDAARVLYVLAEVGAEPRRLLKSADEMGTWIKRAEDALESAYYRHLVAGDTVGPALAVLYLYDFSPVPANEFYAYGIGLDREGVALLETVEELAQREPLALWPNFEIDFYLTHPALAGPDMGNHAIAAARWLRKRGNALRDQARQQASFNEFQRYLHAALLLYRVSQAIYAAVLRLYGAVLLRPTDIQKEADACEEHRVHIMTSLNYVAYDVHHHAPNFADVGQFGAWLDELLGMAPDQAEMHIYDGYNRLIYPAFIRDLALGWLQLHNPTSFDAGQRRWLGVAGQLENNFLVNTMQGENYLSALYANLADLLTRAGRPEEARPFAEKSTLAYLHARQTEVFENRQAGSG